MMILYTRSLETCSMKCSILRMLEDTFSTKKHFELLRSLKVRTCRTLNLRSFSSVDHFFRSHCCLIGDYGWCTENKWEAQLCWLSVNQPLKTWIQPPESFLDIVCFWGLHTWSCSSLSATWHQSWRLHVSWHEEWCHECVLSLTWWDFSFRCCVPVAVKLENQDRFRHLSVN